MKILVTDTKTGERHIIEPDKIQMIEFTKAAVKVYFKDTRTPVLNIKANQLIFS